MSDCALPNGRWSAPTHSPDEDALTVMAHFTDGSERPCTMHRMGRTLDYLESDGERFERVCECEMEPSFIEPSRLDFMQEYLCSECGEYSYMLIACDGDGVNYCSKCGAKVKVG